MVKASRNVALVVSCLTSMILTVAAWAGAQARTVGIPTTVLKVTRNVPTATSPIGTLTGYGELPGAVNDWSVWAPLVREKGAHYLVGSYDLKSFMQINLYVQSAGYYLINVVAARVFAAELRKYGAGMCCPYAVVAGGQWSNANPGYTAYLSYPVVLNLAAGQHYLYWVPTSVDASASVSEISVTKL